MQDTPPPNPTLARIPIWQQAAVACAGPGVAMWTELRQWRELPDGAQTWQTFLFGLSTAWWWVWLALLPLVLLFGRRRLPARWRLRWLGTPAACFLFCFLLGVGLSAGFGWRVRDLPPLYHDEYSYRFQAQTFLAGRLAYPEPEYAPLFDQMHVLNSGVFASRYFPGVGAWLAPFEWLGMPIAGWWLANGLIAGFLGLAGHRFSPTAGYCAGVLSACSPGMAALGNLLLSPQPTMLGFVVFLWAYPAIFERRGVVWPLLAGLAIGFAFLCRPLTAAGLGLPFALYSLYRARFLPAPGYTGKLLVLSATFALSLVALALYDRAITGDPLTSPYGLYIATRTPSHVYGFYNRTRGACRQSDATLRAYDDWSDDLTPKLAVEQVGQRVMGLCRWSAGVPLVVWLGLLALLQLHRGDDRTLLAALALAGLLAAYLPFGFAGLLGWGYMFEAMPPLFLLMGWSLGRLCNDAVSRDRPMLQCWWMGLAALIITTNVVHQLPAVFDWGSEVVYPRRQFQIQADFERKAVQSGPILVIVDADPKDSLHSTYVYNRPTLDGSVLRAWNLGADSYKLAADHPERAVYLFRPARDGQAPTWQRLRSALSGQ